MTKPTGRPRGRPKTKEYVTLMARVDVALADQAQRYARLHRQTISDVLRDGLQVLFSEQDPWRPILSDSNAVPDIAYDMNKDAEIVSDEKPVPDIASDSNAVTGITSDMNKGAEIVSDMNRDEGILSDRNAVPAVLLTASTEDVPAPAAILTDHIADDQDYYPAIHSLGKLCPRKHDYRGTGQSVLRRTNRHCRACDREKFHERKQAKRQAQRA
jgi:hypothetical protein